MQLEMLESNGYLIFLLKHTISALEFIFHALVYLYNLPAEFVNMFKLHRINYSFRNNFHLWIWSRNINIWFTAVLGWFNSTFRMENLHSYDKILEYHHTGDVFLLFMFQNLGIRRMLFYKYWKDNSTQPFLMQDLNSMDSMHECIRKRMIKQMKKKTERTFLYFKEK